MTTPYAHDQCSVIPASQVGCNTLYSCAEPGWTGCSVQLPVKQKVQSTRYKVQQSPLHQKKACHEAGRPPSLHAVCICMYVPVRMNQNQPMSVVKTGCGYWPLSRESTFFFFFFCLIIRSSGNASWPHTYIEFFGWRRGPSGVFAISRVYWRTDGRSTAIGSLLWPLEVMLVGMLFKSRGWFCTI